MVDLQDLKVTKELLDLLQDLKEIWDLKETMELKEPMDLKELLDQEVEVEFLGLFHLIL